MSHDTRHRTEHRYLNTWLPHMRPLFTEFSTMTPAAPQPNPTHPITGDGVYPGQNTGPTTECSVIKGVGCDRYLLYSPQWPLLHPNPTQPNPPHNGRRRVSWSEYWPNHWVLCDQRSRMRPLFTVFSTMTPAAPQPNPTHPITGDGVYPSQNIDPTTECSVIKGVRLSNAWNMIICFSTDHSLAGDAYILFPPALPQLLRSCFLRERLRLPVHYLNTKRRKQYE